MNQIVSLSGGKDSTAMLLMMLERGEPIHSVVFFDTGWEFPQMYDHIKKLEKHTGIKFVRLCSKKSFTETTIKISWPQPRFRRCTGMKRDVIATHHGKNKPYISCRGIAVDETRRIVQKARKIHKGCSVRFPLVEWAVTEEDALQYCYKHGFDWDGLYKLFSRVSCYCCPLKKIGDLKAIRKNFPELWQKMLNLDSAIIKNRGFRGYKTVHDLELQFSEEDMSNSLQPKLLEVKKL